VTFDRTVSVIRILLGTVWLAGQLYIITFPSIPMIQRPLHLMTAMALVILWTPLDAGRLGRMAGRIVDLLILASIAATTVYYMIEANRLTARMEGIDEVMTHDIVFGTVVIVVLMECVRRVVGWSLLGVIVAFLFYGFFGSWFPGWMEFSGFSFAEVIENFTMTANGILGITTATSVHFVFYFVVFGALYSAIGGSQLFIDIGLSAVGTQRGGAAKAAVVSSSMMGSISGSAVANVAATGVFTIPFMRRTGYTAERAAATEAIASTGGQLMPPIMGIAAFLMAEVLQMDYGRIALAGIIPAVAFYVAVFLAVDLHARRTGTGTVSKLDIGEMAKVLPRLYLLAPPVILIGFLVQGYSATYSAVIAILSCPVVAYLNRKSWLGPKDWIAAIGNATKQTAQVAAPIAAIGMIIAVAIQSNLALKFSNRLMDISGGTLIGAMVVVILGCIIMGMGLPTVAAYAIGAVMFAPALVKLGIPELSAHFFVMYFCVLSMVTPPVALASYTAAGMAGANTMQTSLQAFRISIVSFFIPFAFAFDPALLGYGSLPWILFAFVSLTIGTAAWAIAIEGYLFGPLSVVERSLFGLASMVAIFSPTGHIAWAGAMAVILLLTGWRWRMGKSRTEVHSP
jgi:TRAP transporter 4TM/12TM fusion protein